MAHLIPPMNDEPPPDYLRYASARRTTLLRDAARLTGNDQAAAATIAMEVLTDLATHWRRLTWQSRLRHADAYGSFLTRRLEARTKQWREEQLYPVEVSPRTPRPSPATYRRRPTSVALNLAALTPTTVRDPTTATAEAAIAWVHAYRRFLWRHYTRASVGMILLLGYLVHVMEQLSGTG